MMSSENKQTACSRILKPVNWRAFVLEDDGRQKRHLAEKRCAFVKNLAVAANPDGSNIKLSVGTMASELGTVRQTVYDLIEDLVRLDFMEEGGLVWFLKKQVRIRKLKLANILKAAGLPLPVQSSTADPSNLRGSGVQSSQVPVQSSQVPVQSSPAPVRDEDWTQPGVDPPTQPPPPPPTGGGMELEKKHLATIGSWGKRNLERLDAVIASHGYAAVDVALDAIVKEGFGECTSKSGVALHRLPEAIAKDAKKRADAIQKSKDEVAQARSVERQTQEIVERFSKRPKQNEADISELL